ncbi:unnamed protein product [Diabrotica balteata]|uniref:RRM domain-containing protein n=1 Tax=Diabrotica balteata TaxID=107213 RepID=A0A9P0GYK6_DIABA|nr:unnamed protein product [Diabrotica balteata]
MNSEASVVRVVHLDDLTTEYSLKEFLLSSSLVLGAINNVFINIDNELQIVFAYVIFENHHDAKAVVNRLNGFCFQNKVLEIELIGPNLPYKRYTKQTSKSNAISTKSNDVSTNSLDIRHKTLNITSPTKTLNSQSNDLDIDSPIYVSPINTWHPGDYRHSFKPATTIKTTTQTATNPLNSARFINKNNNETSAAISNPLKAKNDTRQAGTYTSRVSGLSSSTSHLRFNRVSSNATNNKIQAFFSNRAAAKPRNTVLTQDKMPKSASLSSISSTMSHPDAFNRTQTEPTSSLYSAVYQSNYSTPRTSYSSLSSVRYQSNVSTEIKSLSSSASHLRLNRVSSNATNNKIQALFF